MASGRLGAADLAAATNTTVYTVPTGKVGTFSVNICNRNSTGARIRIALAAAGGGAPLATEYIEYDAILDGNDVLERTALVLDGDRRVIVYSDVANISAVIYGFER
jgi:hypothetical protein